jgi:hypothetical protein
VGTDTVTTAVRPVAVEICVTAVRAVKVTVVSKAADDIAVVEAAAAALNPDEQPLVARAQDRTDSASQEAVVVIVLGKGCMSEDAVVSNETATTLVCRGKLDAPT